MTTITVTAEHIAKGVPESCRHCPVALAIKDALPGIELIAVDDTRVHLGGAACDVKIDLPPAAQHFIEAFDCDDPVEPFSFTVDYPEVQA
jgi:hypothetical protein